MSRHYRDPLTEHMVTHKHDLRDGSMGEAEGAPGSGETAAQREQNRIKKDPVDEALRPSHVLGGEKNAPAPLSGKEVGAGLGGLADEGGEAAGGGGGTGRRTQEGLQKGSGKASQGVGGLEGRESVMGG